SELGGNHRSPTKRSKGFAYEFFVCKWSVNFSGIKKRDPAFDGRPNQGDHLLFIRRRAVAKAHSHTTEPERRHFQVAISQFALLHRSSFVSYCLSWIPQRFSSE